MALFNRSASILVDTNDERTVIDTVRITFRCEKTTNQTKNSAVLSIYNLAEATRAKIDADGAQITIKAGYTEDSGEEVLFVGDVVYTNHRFVSPDIISEIELKDGGNALRDSRFSESFKPGTTAKQVIDKLAKALGLPIKEITAELSEAYANGLSISGQVGDSLNVLAKKFNFEWTVTDGETQIIKKDTANTETVIVLNAGTGLIGFPGRVVDDKNKLKAAQDPNKKLNIESLLIPRLNPTRKIKLESKIVTGLYKIDSVTHEGDTHGDKWSSNLAVTAI